MMYVIGGKILLAILLVPMLCQAGGISNGTRDFTPTREMSSDDWSDPEEMERAWQAALVRIPTEDKVISTDIANLDGAELRTVPKLPTVIYLHGCSGVWHGTYTRIDILAASGFAVIAPASMARKKYPKSCDPEARRGGLYRATLQMRHFDAKHAIRKARELVWVDPDNLFLMGFSQGGIAAATFESGPDTAVNARVVEGWTCHAGWTEYKGINAPESEPVLTLVAKDDPWFRNPWSRGDCGKFLHSSNGSHSIVYDEEPLVSRHPLLEKDTVQDVVIKFLRGHLR